MFTSLLSSFTASITFFELLSKSAQFRKLSSPVSARILSISLPRSYVVISLIAINSIIII